MTAPTGAVPAKIASSPTAKMTMNHTNPVAVAGGNQKAATIATNPSAALIPACMYVKCMSYDIDNQPTKYKMDRQQQCAFPECFI